MWHSVNPRCIYKPNLNSYLKHYRGCAPDMMQFLETRSVVKFKVTVTQLWYATLRHPKMHHLTKFELPTSNNMRYAPDTIILKTRSEVNVTVIRKWYATLSHPMMYPRTNFGIPTSKNVRDMLWTQYFLKLGQRQGHIDLKMICDTPSSQDAFTQRIWNSYLKEYRRYASDSR